ncbi:MAG: hypothetical protein AAF293_01460 [Pseudomonadota bacterium]
MSQLVRTCLCAAMLAVCAPASAQSIPELKLPQELDKTFRKFMEDLKPSLDETFEYLDEFDGVGDPRNYHMPEVLPNGDIILRRREDAPEYQAPEGTDEPAPGVRT